MKKIATLITLFILASRVQAATNITTDTVSGHWTLAGSPFKIFNNISVTPWQTLIIDPGVEVVFQGYYQLVVADGAQLIAQGTASQRISFKIADTTGWSDTSLVQGGWAGISSYDMFSTADSAFAYCDFSDMKNAGIIISDRNTRFINCKFSHCISKEASAVIMILNITAGVEITQCEFYNNICFDYASVMNLNGGEYTYLNENIFRDNQAPVVVVADAKNTVMKNCIVRDNTQNILSELFSIINIFRSKGQITGNKIYRNTSISIATLSCDGSKFQINENMICNNRTVNTYNGDPICLNTMGGSGMRLSGGDSIYYPNYTIKNNVIANNHASLTGGGIFLYQCNANIFNNQMVHNTSGHPGTLLTDHPGIYVSRYFGAQPNHIQIKNNLFYGNKGTTNTHNIYCELPDTIDLMNNWVEAPFNDHMGTAGSMAIFTGIATNLTGTTPNMIAPTINADVNEDALNKDFGIKGSSPCVNAGVSIGTAAGATDMVGNPRIHGSSIDIGAYEYGPWTLYTNTTIPAAEMAMHIYPNPAQQAISVSVGQPKGTLTVNNVMGQMVREHTVKETETILQINDLPKGLYFVQWQHGAETAIQKLVLE